MEGGEDELTYEEMYTKFHEQFYSGVSNEEIEERIEEGNPLKYYSKEDFQNEPKVVIHLAKNEIYAKHGYIFKEKLVRLRSLTFFLTF